MVNDPLTIMKNFHGKTVADLLNSRPYAMKPAGILAPRQVIQKMGCSTACDERGKNMPIVISIAGTMTVS